ncbi:MAG: hypothetical protein AAF216_08190 [Pseudomonadota bacterium]
MHSLFNSDVSRLLRRHPAAILFVLVTFVCLTRRPDQLFSAGVWVEEGVQFFPQFLENGPLFLFDHVNGYLIVPSKMVALLSYLTSFEYYPEASLFYTILITTLVSVAILKSPTFLHFRFLAALAPVLVPSDPEIIAIGEYVFWQTSILGMLAVLWKPDAGRWLAQGSLIVIGGLSSPLIIALTPVFILRLIAFDTKRESLGVALALLVSLLQLSFLFSTGNNSAERGLFDAFFQYPLETVIMLVEKFLGDFVLNLNSPISLVLGSLVFAGLITVCFRAMVARNWAIPLLILVLGTTGVTLLRIDINAIDAQGAGPRYFFLTYIVLPWIGLYAISEYGNITRALVTAALGCSLLNLSGTYVRHHDPLNWQGAARACVNNAPITPQQLTNRAITYMRNPAVQEASRFTPDQVTAWPTLYASYELEGEASRDATNRTVATREMALGTGTRDHFTGRVTLRLAPDTPTRNVAIEFIAGPSTDNLQIEVIHSTGDTQVYQGTDLPSSSGDWGWYGFRDVNEITFVDNGVDWGQWIALNGEVRLAPDEAFNTIFLMPVQFNGTRSRAWILELSHEQCEGFDRLSVF